LENREFYFLAVKDLTIKRDVVFGKFSFHWSSPKAAPVLADEGGNSYGNFRLFLAVPNSFAITIACVTVTTIPSGAM
jgi:hypothetical protein